MEQSEKQLARNTFFLYVMQISGYVFPLLTFPYLTRVLGSEKYGVVIFANAVMQYFSMFIEFGFLLSSTNDISLKRDNKEEVSRIVESVLLAKLFLFLIGLIVLLICCCFVTIFKTSWLYFLLFYISTFFSIFLPDFLFRGIEQMSVITYRVLLSKAVYTIIIFIFIHTNNDYLFVPVALICGNVAAVILTWIAIFRKKIIKLVPIRIKDIFLTLKKSSTFFLSRIAVSAYTTLNTVLLGFNFSSTQMGEYGAANTLITTSRSMISPLSDSIYPYMIKNRNFKLVKKLILLIEPFIILGCILFALFSKIIIRIICGEGYDNAISIIYAMLPLVVIALPTYLFGYPVLGALGKIKIANISVMVGAIFHITGLGILYILHALNFISVPILTFITELIVFLIRFVTAINALKKHKINDGVNEK